MSKKKDMLGAVVRALVGVPLQFLGVILDLCNKLAGTDGKLWYGRIRATLSESVPPVTPLIEQDITVLGTITVLGGISLADRIAVGCYDGSINLSITEENLPHDPASVGEWEWKIFHFERNVSSEEVDVAITADGWQAAKMEHLLAFGEKYLYPNEQHWLPVFALGSTCSLGGDRRVLELKFDGAKRCLDLGYWDGGWVSGCLFLAVRKKV
jgi:hypothetical protein